MIEIDAIERLKETKRLKRALKYDCTNKSYGRLTKLRFTSWMIAFSAASLKVLNLQA
jgi:hypothetical protein